MTAPGASASSGPTRLRKETERGRSLSSSTGTPESTTGAVRRAARSTAAASAVSVETGVRTTARVVSATDAPVDGTLTIDQDATIYVSSLDAGKELTHESKPGRHAYFFVIDGEAELNGRPLKRGDQARIADETRLSIKATKDAELMLLDLS